MYVYVLGRIWLPSALHELNFNNVVQGRCWYSVELGVGKYRMWVLFWLGNVSVPFLTMWRTVIVSFAAWLKGVCFYVCIYRHQREPDKISGYPKRLWVLCKEKQIWQHSDEIPIAFALSNECAGKVWLWFIYFFYNCDLVHLLHALTSLKGSNVHHHCWLHDWKWKTREQVTLPFSHPRFKKR